MATGSRRRVAAAVIAAVGKGCSWDCVLAAMELTGAAALRPRGIGGGGGRPGCPALAAEAGIHQRSAPQVLRGSAAEGVGGGGKGTLPSSGPWVSSPAMRARRRSSRLGKEAGQHLDANAKSVWVANTN